MKITIKYLVVGTYEDGSEDVFEQFDQYEDAEKYIKETEYVAEMFEVRKVFFKN